MENEKRILEHCNMAAFEIKCEKCFNYADCMNEKVKREKKFKPLTSPTLKYGARDYERKNPYD